MKYCSICDSKKKEYHSKKGVYYHCLVCQRRRNKEYRRRHNLVRTPYRCWYVDCIEMTVGKYGLCIPHYKLQWGRKNRGLISKIEEPYKPKKYPLPNCGDCGIELKDMRSKYCRKHQNVGVRNGMYRKYGKLSPHYKTGKSISAGGYMRLNIGGKRLYEHRVVMEKHLGRKLQRGEVVHHIDRNRLNNEIGNLQVMSHSDHIRLHAKESNWGKER